MTKRVNLVKPDETQNISGAEKYPHETFLKLNECVAFSKNGRQRSAKGS